MVKSLALISSFQWKMRSSKLMRKRRRRRRRRRRAPPEIPLDVQMEILSKLPGKSLMRFKCVSKLWYSLIRSRYFSNCYFKIKPTPPRLYISLVDHLDCNSTEVCYNPRDSVLVSLTASSSSSFDQDLTMPGMGGRNMLILRGLVLYLVCRKACVYNPTTRQSITLPAVKSNIFSQAAYRKSVLYFFGHDPVLDQYKVLCTVVISSKTLKRKLTSEHWVLVLEAAACWRKIEFDQPHLPTRLGLCINGVIHYLASNCMRRDIIVSFDVFSEKFSMIQGPPVFSTMNPMGFIDYGGKLAVFNHTHLIRKGLMDLWVLEEAANWSKKSMVLQPCQMHLVNSKNIRLKVKGTTQNGEEVILAPLSPLIYPYYLLYYDLNKNHMSKVDIRGIPQDWFDKPDTNLLIYFHLMYTESIMHLEI